MVPEIDLLLFRANTTRRRDRIFRLLHATSGLLEQGCVPCFGAAAASNVVWPVRVQHVSVEVGLGDGRVSTRVAREQRLWVRELVLLQLFLAVEPLAALAANTTAATTGGGAGTLP